MKIPPEDRHKSQGRWLGIYTSVSFFSLFLITYWYEKKLYDNLDKRRSLWEEWKNHGVEVIQGADTHTWYIQTSSIEIPIHRFKVETLADGYLLYWGHLLFIFACIFGYLVYRLWLTEQPTLMRKNADRYSARSGLWKFVFLAYVAVPFVIATYIYHFMFEVRFVAILYVGLLYITRGVMRFNPHQEVVASGSVKGEIVSGIIKLYQQYIILSLAAVGLISTTFLFAVQSSFREIFKVLAPIFPLIEWPNYVAQIWLTVVGCSGLLIVIRELNIKLHEVFKMDSQELSIDPSVAPTTSRSISVSEVQSLSQSSHYLPKLRASHVVLFLIAWMLRPRRR